MDARVYTLYLVVFFMGVNTCFSSEMQKEKVCTDEDVGKLSCSDDCTQILKCTAVGASPIHVQTCPDKKFCKVTNATTGEADCSAEEPACGALGNDNVKCGAFGEFPHPTKCDTTIRCDSALTIQERCTCTAGSYVNISKPLLPCEEGECSRVPVNCTNNIGGQGTFPGSEDYCYICWAEGNPPTDVIIVKPCDGSQLSLKSIFYPSSKSKNCVTVELN